MFIVQVCAKPHALHDQSVVQLPGAGGVHERVEVSNDVLVHKGEQDLGLRLDLVQITARRNLDELHSVPGQHEHACVSVGNGV